MELLQTNKGILYKICRIYLKEPQDQQDLLQEIVLQLWNSYDSFHGDSKFSSWMYRVALNTAITFYKKERKRTEYLTSISPDTETLSETTYGEEDRREKLFVFYKAIHELNKVEKALIFLYMEGQPGKEIADCLDISPQNVRVRINRIKQKLQQIIKYMGYEF